MEHEPEPDEVQEVPELPLLPGFREMALRRMLAERRRLVADLTAQRRSAGLSQTEVARHAGMTQPALSRLEAGGVLPTIPLLERITAALDADLIVEISPHAA